MKYCNLIKCPSFNHRRSIDQCRRFRLDHRLLLHTLINAQFHEYKIMT